MEFKYKETSITIDTAGRFVATINGARVRKPSLEAMHKAIDDGIRINFTPFTILDEPRGNDKPDKDGLCKYQVIGIQKEPSGDFVFMVQAGQSYRSDRTLMVDSPENRAAYKAYQKARKERQETIEEMDNKIRKSQEAIQYVRANDYKLT